jgi:energy-coupling factor transporter transmembrane protein EcfT
MDFYHWVTAITLATLVGLHTGIALRAFFFNPPVTLFFWAMLTLAKIVYPQSTTVALFLALIALVGLVGWRVYYIYKDWSSRSLRVVVACFLLCVFVAGSLYEVASDLYKIASDLISE